MTVKHPKAWSRLKNPDGRAVLIRWLEELSIPDPRPIWRDECLHGLISGIDQVFHYFFDDNDFDDSAIGYTLFDAEEVEAIEAIKRALDIILIDLPDGQDDAFVGHVRWPDVTSAAAIASGKIKTG